MPAPKKAAKPAPGQVLGTSAHPTWVWVEDQSTGHRYDVQKGAVRPGMVPVPGYPEHVGKRPRPTKFFRAKDGSPAKFTPRADGPAPEPVDGEPVDQAAGAVDQLAEPSGYDPTEGRDPAPTDAGEPAADAGVPGDAGAADSPASGDDSGTAEPAKPRGRKTT